MDPIPTNQVLCEICSIFQLSSTKEVRSHRHEIHMKEKKFWCHHCGKIMKSWKNLIVHIDAMHPEHGEKKFHCDKCPKSFIFEKSCEIHKYNHIYTEQNAGKTFKCKKCEYSTISKRGYTLHKINNHDSGSLKQCPHCDHKVLTKQNLNGHIENNHSDRVNSDFCLSEFSLTYFNYDFSAFHIFALTC